MLLLRVVLHILVRNASPRGLYIGGYGGLSESGLCVFRELCPVSFLVIRECPSVLL